MEPPNRLGVVGAGTMGAGIAQLGCMAGMQTFLHDPVPEALAAGRERVAKGLAKGAERGRWSEQDAEAALERLRLADELDALAGCELVVEAAPEDPDLKRELFARLSEICGPDAVLATNTSSIPVTSLAGAAAEPASVVGMHFFNPPPLMKLLEVIPAEQTGERASGLARAAGEAMGRRVIVASDGPGFLVNRCGRPFGAEALRLLGERVATHEQIDRICRMGGGFRMGPFELMDLVGIDVGYAVARSFTELSFGEPRWKPSPVQARMVAAGRTGRKAGRGFYEYAEGASRDPDPEPPAPGGGDGGLVVISGTGVLAKELRERAAQAGFEPVEPDALGDRDPKLVVDAEPTEGGVRQVQPHIAAKSAEPPSGPPSLALCAAQSLAQRGEPSAAGFHLLPPLEGVKLVELTRLPSTPDATAQAAERFFTALGLHPEWVEDAPGLVLGRIVCCLVNEAAFAVGEGVGSEDDVNAGVTLGLNHPRGPLEWGRAMGLEHALATVDGLWEERREERYRAAPLLRRWVAAGRA